MTGDTHRLFCAEYSALNQRRVMSEASGRDEYIGQLRFDSLLAETIVVPDSQIFDGAFFVRMWPENLCKLVGRGAHARVLPLIVRARRSTLRESLAHLLERPNSEYLNPFPFHFIRSEHLRSELALGLAETRVQVLRNRLGTTSATAAAVAGLLQDTLHRRGLRADEEVEALKAGWSRWIDADERGIVHVEAWDRPFRLAAAMAVDPVEVDSDLSSALGRRLYKNLRTMAYRSDATMLLDNAAQSAENGPEALDVDTLARWYTDARHRAFAEQHGCAFARSEDPQAPPIGPVRRALERVAQGDWDNETGDLLTLPSCFVDGLTALSGNDFGALTRVASDDLRIWWRTQNPRALEKIIKQLDAVCKPRADMPPDRPALAQLFARLVGQAAVYASSGWKWGLFATLVSEGLLSLREQKKEKGANYVRRRIVEYGLRRIGELP